MTQAVELAGRDPGLDVLVDHVEHRCGQLARAAHAGKGSRVVQRDLNLARCLLGDLQLLVHHDGADPGSGRTIGSGAARRISSSVIRQVRQRVSTPLA